MLIVITEILGAVMLGVGTVAGILAVIHQVRSAKSRP